LGGQNNQVKTKEKSMKKRSLWLTVIGAFFVMVLMSAVAAFAADEGSAWTYGVPIIASQEGFTGNEAMVTEKGTVKKIEKMRGQKDGLQMRLAAEEGGNWVVYMGPKWFIDNQKIKFAVGDKVEVRGKKFGGAIIASEISKGDWTMRIRNEEDGQAVWQCCFPYKERKD
jgi:hypothetical protein